MGEAMQFMQWLWTHQALTCATTGTESRWSCVRRIRQDKETDRGQLTLTVSSSAVVARGKEARTNDLKDRKSQASKYDPDVAVYGRRPCNAASKRWTGRRGRHVSWCSILVKPSKLAPIVSTCRGESASKRPRLRRLLHFGTNSRSRQQYEGYLDLRGVVESLVSFSGAPLVGWQTIICQLVVQHHV
ncbi:hypothetical protein BD289DRAFT_3807 [Coniella lustricola]|uniref:Uncharacterized protein n=1 Tax=Coniella lustricola TaxID=2025994 RepID=A0A2T3ANM8_9PEZI|nr:hypothetical protein BD289DRAFT_3807 [Coniella lustricola]